MFFEVSQREAQLRVCIVMILLATFLFRGVGAAEAASPTTHIIASLREGRLLIQPRAGASEAELERFHALAQCRILRRFPALGGIEVLAIPKERSAEQTLRRYQRSGLFEYAEPDYAVQLASVFPDDPSFLNGTLWGLNNAGQSGGAPNADIDAPEGWSARTAASNVIVAVIDSGVRYSHEDLGANMWTNPNDGSHGINALTGANDPQDDNGHGTRIAGIIGAVGSNGLGVVGVAWRVQVMACKFADQSGNGSVSDALVCLDYARTNGAHIVNASWGLDEFSLSLSNAISALRTAGILVVAAAGNQSRDVDASPRYPAALDLDNIISVAATTRRDELYSLSNFGSSNVDLAAPGDEIYSTDFQSDSAYAFDFGTSMATAYVTGAAALLRAGYPAETPAEIIARFISATDPLPSLTGKCVSGGRLNLRKALAVVLTAPLLRGSLQPPEGFALRLSANPGRDYVVEVSTNLFTWRPSSTNLTGMDGSFVLTNTIESQSTSQFFRARLAQ